MCCRIYLSDSCNNVIRSRRSLRYLRVMIDNKINFKYHIEYVNKKAIKALGSLVRMLSNTGKPMPARNELLSIAVNAHKIILELAVGYNAIHIEETADCTSIPKGLWT